MAAVALLFVVVLALAVIGPFVLYALLNEETRDRPRMDRAEAERRARSSFDGSPDGGRGRRDGTERHEAGPDGTGRHETERHGTERDRAGPDGTGRTGGR